MRRFVAIVTIAMLVLAMSAGTAFASVCTGGACGRVMLCAPTTSMACPMDSGVSMQHSTCDHTAQQVREATPTQAGHDIFVVSVPALTIPSLHVLGGLFAATHAPDARGAPHLSMVSRT
jgi:hypothetical protein